MSNSIKLQTINATAAQLAFCTGCASIVDGGDKSIRINSVPPGAKVTISDKQGKAVCVQTTPAIVPLRRCHGSLSKEDYTLSMELPGYYPAQAHVHSVLDGWYLGNLFFGGFIGCCVDMGTGACYTLSPRDVNCNLVACDASLPPDQVKEIQAKANAPKPRVHATTFPGKTGEH